MAQIPRVPHRPPGSQRTYRKADSGGRLAFQSDQAGIKGETAYWVWGDLSSGRCPLIVLHGGPGVPHGCIISNCLVNDDFDIPVIMYDQIGCGDSTRFKDRKGDAELWTPDLFIEELENVTSWLRSEWNINQYDILGHSWGGRLAALFAIRRQPPGLRKLIIVCTSPDLRDLQQSRRELRALMPSNINTTLARRDAGDEVDSNDSRQAMMYEMALHTCRLQPFPDEVMGAFAALMEDNTVGETMLGFSMNGTLMRMPGIVLDHLKEITEKTCPGGMLIVTGQYDSTQDKYMTKWFSEPQCVVKWVTLALSSHFVMFEETEAYVKAVGSFLES